MKKILNLIIVIGMTIFLASCMSPGGGYGRSGGGGGLNSILPLLLIGVIILVAVKTSKKEDDISTSADQTNKVVNVTLTGGLIGLFGASPQNSLNSRIKKENANGWRVIQVIPADSGNIFLTIFRLLLLIITLFLFTTANGYYVIMERTQLVKQADNNNQST
jgi:hypothetical protein